MTYAEEEGKSVFDWNRALNTAQYEKIKHDKGAPYYYWGLHEELIDRSKSWVTCACGNQCATIPRDKNGRPIDSLLRELGQEFHKQICVQDFETALQTLSKIEEQSIKTLKVIHDVRPPETFYEVDALEPFE